MFLFFFPVFDFRVWLWFFQEIRWDGLTSAGDMASVDIVLRRKVQGISTEEYGIVVEGNARAPDDGVSGATSKELCIGSCFCCCRESGSGHSCEGQSTGARRRRCKL